MHGSLLQGSYAWKFCMDGRLINKYSERMDNLSGSKQKVSVVVGCFSTVILGLSMVDRS